MLAMSKATEIAQNVWLGPSPITDDMLQMPNDDGSEQTSIKKYDLLIETCDSANLPDRQAYSLLNRLLTSDRLSTTSVPQLEFPASGSILPPTWSQSEVDGLMTACTWIYKQANGLMDQSETNAAVEATRGRKDSRITVTPPRKDNDGDSSMTTAEELDAMSPTAPQQGFSSGKNILIHCTDGYTETTLLALAYYMYSNGVPLSQAYIELHKDHGRDFFAYPTDVALLAAIQPRILQASPACLNCSLTTLNPPVPAWLHKIDGSLPSRITDYMYLGNLGHANNPGLLKELGIGQVLSVGESVNWTDEERKKFQGILADGETVQERLMFIDRVQDNGVDPLTDEIPRCLEFIGEDLIAGDLRKSGTNSYYRERTQSRHSYTCALSSRCVSISDHLHRTSHE